MSYVINDEAQIDNLKVQIYKTRSLLGAGASRLVKARVKMLLDQQDYVNIIFAAAPSQREFLKCLSEETDIEWTRINAFHMDEYLGLGDDAQERFGHFLSVNIFDQVPFHKINYLNKGTVDPRDESNRYSDLLRANPPDIVCMGIGENGHIAFNDPHVADFNDPFLVKVVDLDQFCRQQQVNDGCFRQIGDVPTHAITLTIPALLQAHYVFCIVPGSNKAAAVYHALNENVQEKYPSTVLRTHRHAVLLLDENSAARLR